MCHDMCITDTANHLQCYYWKPWLVFQKPQYEVLDQKKIHFKCSGGVKKTAICWAGDAAQLIACLADVNKALGSVPSRAHRCGPCPDIIASATPAVLLKVPRSCFLNWWCVACAYSSWVVLPERFTWLVLGRGQRLVYRRSSSRIPGLQQITCKVPDSR